MASRRLWLVGGGVLVGVLVAGAPAAAGYTYHGTDLLDFSAPQTLCAGAPCTGRYFGAYPWGAYTLDGHLSGFGVGLSGIDTSGLPAIAFATIAGLLWQLALLGLHLAFLVFGFAFSLNLLTGSGGGGQLAGGFGLLDHLRGAVGGIFNATAFQQVLFVSFAAIGAFALWNGLVKRQYARTFQQIAVSVLIYALAIGIIADPTRTIGWAADTSNGTANAMLSLAASVAHGSGGGDLQTREGPLLTAEDGLFKLSVFEPFEILDFGGLSHCAARVATGGSAVAVADPTTSGGGCAPYPSATQVTAAPIATDKYARWYLETANPRCALQLDQAALLADQRKLFSGSTLRLAPGSDPSCVIGPFDGYRDGAPAPNFDAALYAQAAQATGMNPSNPIGRLRGSLFDAIQDNTPDALRSGLHLALRTGWPDAPAGDAQLNDSQAQRLAVATLVVIGSLPVVIVLGGLSVGVVCAQLVVLFGLVILPAVLLLGLFPGRGHRLVADWAKRMATALVCKFIYALVLVAVLAVEFALAGSAQATGFGWLFSYLLQVLFLWVLVMKRRQLSGELNRAITDHRPEHGTWRDELTEVYLGTRLARMGLGGAGGVVHRTRRTVAVGERGLRGLRDRAAESSGTPVAAPSSDGGPPPPPGAAGTGPDPPAGPDQPDGPGGGPPAGGSDRSRGEPSAAGPPPRSRPAVDPGPGPDREKSAPAGAAGESAPADARPGRDRRADPVRAAAPGAAGQADDARPDERRAPAPARADRPGRREDSGEGGRARAGGDRGDGAARARLDAAAEELTHAAREVRDDDRGAVRASGARGPHPPAASAPVPIPLPAGAGDGSAAADPPPEARPPARNGGAAPPRGAGRPTLAEALRRAELDHEDER